MAKIDDPELDRMMKIITIQIAMDRSLAVLKDLRSSLQTSGEEGRQISLDLSDAIEGVEEALKALDRIVK